MQRITDKDLELAVLKLNKVQGTPEQSWSKGPTGLRANVGNYHVEGAYGGVRLVQIVGDGGSIQVISQAGYCTKRELYNIIQSILSFSHCNMINGIYKIA